MRKEYDFSKAKRATEVPHLNALREAQKKKVRISIMLDAEIIEAFRKRAQAAGTGYQTEINRALHVILEKKQTLTLDSVRRVIREELRTRRS